MSTATLNTRYDASQSQPCLRLDQYFKQKHPIFREENKINTQLKNTEKKITIIFSFKSLVYFSMEQSTIISKSLRARGLHNIIQLWTRLTQSRRIANKIAGRSRTQVNASLNP